MSNHNQKLSREKQALWAVITIAVLLVVAVSVKLLTGGKAGNSEQQAQLEASQTQQNMPESESSELTEVTPQEPSETEPISEVTSEVESEAETEEMKAALSKKNLWMEKIFGISLMTLTMR